MKSISFEDAQIRDPDLFLKEDLFVALKKRLNDGRVDANRKTPYSFTSFSEDKEFLGKLHSLSKKETPDLKTIFVVGIGGANLGAKAVIDAFPKSEKREFVFLDTLYPGEREDLRKWSVSFASPTEFLIIVVSKSGQTIETLANVHLLISNLERELGSVNERIIAVTSPNTPLGRWAHHQKIDLVEISENIGDRFSIFSPTGIVPLLFAEISIEKFLDGACEALEMNLNKEIGPAFQIALALSDLVKDGSHVNLDCFLFSRQLETLGKWQRQLIAESLGKEKTVFGNPLGKSITPTVSVGTTDLHSMLQLYLAQPTERISWFVPVESDADASFFTAPSLRSILPGLDKSSPEHILAVIYEQILAEYRKRYIPFIETPLENISESSLGFFMMNTMLVTVALAELWSIDPFDQPNVEAYKQNVRRYLQI